jgi:hypothetical protein
MLLLLDPLLLHLGDKVGHRFISTTLRVIVLNSLEPIFSTLFHCLLLKLMVVLDRGEVA